MPFIELDDVKLYYEEYGKGESIVFTHGNSMYQGQWEPQVAELSKKYRVILWDVRGHGNSSLPPGEVDPESFSRDLIAVLDALKIKSAVLCGLSMGGHISLQAAVRYPQRVRGLVLIGTPFSNNYHWYDKWLVAMNLYSVRLLPYKTTAKWTAQAVNIKHRDIVEKGFASMTHDEFLRQWAGNLRLETKHDLHKVGCPTVILHGDKDVFVARQQAALTEGIAGAQYYFIPNAGHLTNLDNPEAVNQHIDDFMQSLAAK